MMVIGLQKNVCHGQEVPVARFTITPRKFNIAPEKWWLEDCLPIGAW